MAGRWTDPEPDPRTDGAPDREVAKADDWSAAVPEDRRARPVTGTTPAG